VADILQFIGFVSVPNCRLSCYITSFAMPIFPITNISCPDPAKDESGKRSNRVNFDCGGMKGGMWRLPRFQYGTRNIVAFRGLLLPEVVLTRGLYTRRSCLTSAVLNCNVLGLSAFLYQTRTIQFDGVSPVNP